MHRAKTAQHRRGRRTIAYLWVLFASLALHTVALTILGLTAPSRRSPLERGDDGERGHERGAGGPTEFSIDRTSPCAAPIERATIAPLAPTTPVEAFRSNPRVTHRSVRPTPPRASVTTEHAEAARPTAPEPPTPTAAPAPSEQTSPPLDPSQHAAGPSSGQRTGSVGEQRAMLPAAARCRDIVAGTWRAHKYNPQDHDWVIFTLRIHRLPDNRLQGSIVARLWTGYAMDSRPPGRCGGLLHDLDYLVRMPAQGSLTNGTHVTFSAITYHVERAFCASAYFSYNPDAFSGDIDEERQEFQSVNNDGGRDRNAPYVFRRIGCLPGDELPAQSR
jgi:hypothetical protein